MIYTEYDPLTKIVVGDTYAPGDVDHLLTAGNINQFNRILEETKHDLDALADFLKKGNIEVLRPDVYRYDAIKMPHFRIDMPISPIVPRDQYLVMGDIIMQTYTSYTDRYFDSISYYKIFEKLFRHNNMRWISQPAPMLKDLNVKDEWFLNDRTYEEQLSDKLLWHTATMFKAGDAFIVNHRGPGSNLGYQWMQRELKDYRFVENNHTHSKGFGHIDHGFIMIDDDTVIHGGISWVPECLRNKKLIDVSDCITELNAEQYCRDISEFQTRMDVAWLDKYLENWRGYSQAVCFDLNVLVIDSQNIIFARHIPKLFAKLKELHIDCHVVPQRHYLYWEGGIHCSTLDIARKGEKRKII
jgi:glycine amidinotransferase